MLRILLIVLVIAVAAPLYANEAPLVGRNLLKNESFENRPGFKDSTPINWGGFNSSYNGISTTVRRRGQQSVHMNCPKQGESTGIFYTYKNVKPGYRYNFSAYFLNYGSDPISGNAFGQLHIEWRKMTNDNKDAKELSRDYGPTFGPGTSTMKWTFITMSVIAPMDADNCNFVIEFANKEKGAGRLYTDDAAAEEIKTKEGIKGYMLADTRPGLKNVTLVEKAEAEKAGSKTSGGQEEKAELSLVAANFNAGDLESGGGIWTKDPNDNTQGCTLTYNQNVKRGDSGFSLQLDYDVDSPNQAMVGLWMALQNLDLSQYGKLSLWIKGDETAGFSKGIKLELKNRKGEVGKYTLSGITKDWKRFVIPVKEFTDLEDISAVSEFVIRFDDEVNSDKKTGRIYVDDISFGK